MSEPRKSRPGIIKNRLSEIAGEFVEKSGEDICLSLTGTIDSYLIEVGQHLLDRTAIFALGGYGRRELSMGSDIDLLILYDQSDQGRIRDWLKDFLHEVWDARVEVKYSAHTLREVKEKVESDTDFATAILDYRALPGNEDLGRRFTDWITGYFGESRPEYVEAKLKEDRNRRARFGDTYKLLNPDIKESAGGLRDLHTIHWLSVGTGKRVPGVTREDLPSTFDLLRWMLNQGTITVREYASLKEAYSFLLKLRHGVHALENTGLKKNTRLDLNIRHQLAGALGYNRDGEPDIQALMQSYYRAAREIDYAHSFFLNDLFQSKDDRSEVVSLNDFPGFARRNGDLVAPEDTGGPLKPAEILRLFQYTQHADLQLTRSARNRIEQMVHSLPAQEFQTPEVGGLLGDILLSEDAADILRALLYTEILIKIIPEIGKIRRLHIKSRFHHYTVDEHTFRTIDTLQDAVLNEEPDQPWEFVRIYAEIHDHLPLYWALLLHDVWKADDPEHHEEIGSREVEEVLVRLGQTEYVRKVQHLIKNHLKMEQFAFRRDINRPENITAFGELVETADTLRSLYLFTFADISAVKPELWSDWKATLLYELYVKTLHFLQDKTVEATREAIVEQTAVGESRVDTHLEQMEPKYMTQFSAEQIGEHLQAIGEIKEGKTLHLLYTEEVALSHITVITTDRQELLASICGVLSGHNLDIIDASIFTREDGVVIDHFRVVPVAGVEAGPELRDELQESLHGVFAGEVSPGALVKSAEDRWRWQKKQQTGTVSPFVTWVNEGGYIVLEVTGRDRIGLLYYLSGLISNAGFDIHSAKIHTENQTITDIFYLTCDEDDQERRLTRLKAELVDFLE